MTKDTIRKQFGDNAAAYTESKVHARGASLPRLLETVQPQADWHMLDIATGAGHTALAFAPHVRQVTATDITPQMLEETRRLVEERDLHNVVIETADAESLPYEDQAFDLVTCRIAPHHFADISKFLRESARVLRPGGLLAIVDNIVPPGPAGAYVNAFEKLRDPSHGRCLSIEEWQTALRAAGLSIRHSETLAKQMDFTFWAKRHDPAMQSYLLAMLSEVSGPAALFLRPQITPAATHFTLTEALTIAQKPPVPS